MRNCTDCATCCSGIIPGEINGTQFRLGTPCMYSTGNSCAIYNSKPVMCSDFKCIWVVEDTIPDSLDPRHSGVLLVYARNDIRAFVDSINTPHLAYLEALAQERQCLVTVIFDDIEVAVFGDTNG